MARTRSHNIGDRYTVDLNWLAIDQHMANAFGFVSSQAFGVGGEVAHSSHRTRVYRFRVEDGDISPVARSQITPIAKTKQVSLLAAEFANRCFHRHHIAAAHPVAEQIGGLRRITELTNMGSGV